MVVVGARNERVSAEIRALRDRRPLLVNPRGKFKRYGSQCVESMTVAYLTIA